jgi:hypothetical protein
MPKRKKYNPLKQLQSLSNIALKDHAIGCIPTKTYSELINLKTNSVVPINNTKLKMITELRHKWSVFIAVFGIDSQNQYYMKSNEVIVANPVFQSELSDTLNTHHQTLCSQFNPNHLISVGWLATPYSKVWDEQKAFKVLENLGALSFKRDEDNNIIEV